MPAVLHAALIQQALDKFNGAQFAQEAGIKADLIDSVLDLLWRDWQFFAFQRVDVDDHDVIWQPRLKQRKQRRVPGISAIPERFLAAGVGVVNLYRLKDRGQTGRGHDGLRGYLIARKDLDLAVADPGGTDEQHRINAIADPVIIEPVHDIAKRVAKKGAHRIGRCDIGYRVRKHHRPAVFHGLAQRAYAPWGHPLRHPQV